MSLLDNLETLYREYISVGHDGIIRNFRDGVEDTTSTTNLYLDPDHIEDGDDVKQQLEDQAPGISDEIWESLSQLAVLSSSDKEGMFDEIANAFKDGGPAALSHETLTTDDGTRICIINEPSRDVDQKEELINAFSGHFDNLDKDRAESVPGGDIDYARAVGVHEGTHCEQDDDEYLTQREKEIDADEAALKDQLSRGNTSVAKTIYEAREVGARNGADLDHQTADKIKFGELKEQFYPEARGARTEPSAQPSGPQPKADATFNAGM